MRIFSSTNYRIIESHNHVIALSCKQWNERVIIFSTSARKRLTGFERVNFFFFFQEQDVVCENKSFTYHIDELRQLKLDAYTQHVRGVHHRAHELVVVGQQVVVEPLRVRIPGDGCVNDERREKPYAQRFPDYGGHHGPLITPLWATRVRPFCTTRSGRTNHVSKWWEDEDQRLCDLSFFLFSFFFVRKRAPLMEVSIFI